MDRSKRFGAHSRERGVEALDVAHDQFKRSAAQPMLTIR
ncbi:unnamed protein product, partial [Rotaria magnacalcarata]